MKINKVIFNIHFQNSLNTQLYHTLKNKYRFWNKEGRVFSYITKDKLIIRKSSILRKPDCSQCEAQTFFPKLVFITDHEPKSTPAEDRSGNTLTLPRQSTHWPKTLLTGLNCDTQNTVTADTRTPEQHSYSRRTYPKHSYRRHAYPGTQLPQTRVPQNTVTTNTRTRISVNSQGSSRNHVVSEVFFYLQYNSWNLDILCKIKFWETFVPDIFRET